jgi:hypothetical protein
MRKYKYNNKKIKKQPLEYGSVCVEFCFSFYGSDFDVFDDERTEQNRTEQIGDDLLVIL